MKMGVVYTTQLPKFIQITKKCRASPKQWEMFQKFPGIDEELKEVNLISKYVLAALTSYRSTNKYQTKQKKKGMAQQLASGLFTTYLQRYVFREEPIRYPTSKEPNKTKQPPLLSPLN